MSYQHQYVDGTRIHFPLGKVVCIGRNYAEHAKELDNPIPTEPLYRNNLYQLKKLSEFYHAWFRLLRSFDLEHVGQQQPFQCPICR